MLNDEIWTQLEWIQRYAAFFNMPVEDVKLVFQLFLGDRVKEWPHPFGELEIIAANLPWVERDRMVREKGWTWQRVGPNILQNELYRKAPASVTMFDHLTNSVREHQKRSRSKELSFLDYGCGTANLVENLLRLPGIRFHLQDVNLTLVKYCRYKFKEHADRVTCELIPIREKLEGDACRVHTRRKVVSGRFDIIHIVDVLEHTLNPLSLLRQLVQALEPGGLLIFIFPDDIEGDWHTPEANFLRPLCLELIEAIFTRQSDIVWEKSLPISQERKILRRYAFRHALAYPRARLFARRYFRENGMPER